MKSALDKFLDGDIPSYVESGMLDLDYFSITSWKEDLGTCAYETNPYAIRPLATFTDHTMDKPYYGFNETKGKLKPKKFVPKTPAEEYIEFVIRKDHLFGHLEFPHIPKNMYRPKVLFSKKLSKGVKRVLHPMTPVSFDVDEALSRIIRDNIVDADKIAKKYNIAVRKRKDAERSLEWACTRHMHINPFRARPRTDHSRDSKQSSTAAKSVKYTNKPNPIVDREVTFGFEIKPMTNTKFVANIDRFYIEYDNGIFPGFWRDRHDIYDFSDSSIIDAINYVENAINVKLNYKTTDGINTIRRNLCKEVIRKCIRPIVISFENKLTNTTFYVKIGFWYNPSKGKHEVVIGRAYENTYDFMPDAGMVNLPLVSMDKARSVIDYYLDCNHLGKINDDFMKFLQEWSDEVDDFFLTFYLRFNRRLQ